MRCPDAFNHVIKETNLIILLKGITSCVMEFFHHLCISHQHYFIQLVTREKRSTLSHSFFAVCLQHNIHSGHISTNKITRHMANKHETDCLYRSGYATGFMDDGHLQPG